MLTIIHRICIFAFVISSVFHIGDASSLDIPSMRTIAAVSGVTPAQAPAPVTAPASAVLDDEAQINLRSTAFSTKAQGQLKAATTTTTITTIASSNAPATTIEAAQTVTGTATSEQNPDNDSTDDDGIMTTMLPEFFQQITKFEENSSTAPTASGAVVLDRNEAVGNEVKIEMEKTQKNEASQPLVTRNPQSTTTTAAEMTTKSREWKESGSEKTLPTTTTTVPRTTPLDIADAMDSHIHNHIKVEGRLKNGLYRIKLAEIVTDEFDSLPKNANEEEGKTSHTHEHDNAEEKEKEKENENSNNNNNNNRSFSSGGGKVNIADLYPMKKEDFNPIIRDSNTKLLDEHTIFKKPVDVAEYRQNLLPNEVEIQEHSRTTQSQTQRGTFARETTKAQIKQRQFPTLDMTLMSSNVGGRRPAEDNTHHSEGDVNGNTDGDTISDFTGKLLAERDGIITEIEEKFRLNEFVATERSKISSTSEATTLKSFANSIPTTTTTTTTTTTAAKPTVSSKPASYMSQKELLNKVHGGHEFIDRRVKKSYSFPMHRAASDVMSEPYVDFANTKFTGSSSDSSSFSSNRKAIPNGNPAVSAKTFTADSATNSDGVVLAGAAHPAFSTTKFYNSKELYNEMIMHNRLKQLQNKSGTTITTTTKTTTTTAAATINTNSPASEQLQTNGFTATTTVLPTPGAASRFAMMKNNKSSSLVSKDQFSSTSSSRANPIVGKSSTSTTTTTKSWTTSTTTEPSGAELGFEISSVDAGKNKKFQNELKRAKLLLKVMIPPTKAVSTAPPITTTTTATNTSIAAAMTPIIASPMSSLIAQSSLNLSIARTATMSSSMTSTTLATTNSADAAATVTAATSNTMPAVQQIVTNPTKSASKPIPRPLLLRMATSLQEKINSLECEMQNVPQDSHLWRGNETHELLLPIITPAHCAAALQERLQQQQQHHQQQQQGEYQNQHQQSDDNDDDDDEDSSCSTESVSISWDGESEIQSGDILIVEINDASLLKNKTNAYSAHFTQVYQVTRSGHEHCDVTEGILLDITPLVVDGRKLVTLYDKDLTEGVNLLIVVSELWGSECVRLKVTAKTDNCGENADCSGKGVCYSNKAMEEYECQCCSGFAGPHCEEIDACTPSPCTNNGICVDLSQGHDGNSYQCLCPYGYTGKNCQYESDPCNPAECMNGGSCVGNSTHFRCDCSPGYAGPLCQHSLNECESSPCVHGICVDQEDGFRCFCQPGFAGELCNFEYNECESNPCQNGGECIDHIGSFECRCTKGYAGNRCEIKVEFCANKPCPEGHRCIDHGNDFSCECPGGRNGPDCNRMARTQCNVNPCTHGGTCWSSGDSFYCACRPGYTGTMCEDEFVVETVVSSSEFIVDDVNAQNLNDKTFGSSVVLKSPIELHNAYFAAGVLAAAFFIVAVVVTICHCKVNQTYRKFSTRTTSFIPIIGFGRRPKPQSKLNKHWLSGKGLGSGGNSLRSSTSATSRCNGVHLSHATSSTSTSASASTTTTNVGQLHERPFQRHLAMNLENDMYYTVDFSENSQHSPLIQ